MPPLILIVIVLVALAAQLAALIVILVLVRRVASEMREVFRLLGHILTEAIETDDGQARAVGDRPTPRSD